MITIDRDIGKDKAALIDYFRNRSSESLEEIKRIEGESNHKNVAKRANEANVDTRENLLTALELKAKKEGWTDTEVLEAVLMIHYTSYVVMIETRNDAWQYDYMVFSRRIGELWEPFCKKCFEYPVNDLTLFVPPLFSEVQLKLTNEIIDYIDSLNILDEQKAELKSITKKCGVWLTREK